MAIDLFNEALGIEGGEPVTINVGDVELTVRTSHTGLQAAAWMQAESKRVEAVETILADTELTDAQKVQRLSKAVKTYAVELIKSVTIDADTKDVTAAAAAMVALPADARTRVFRTLGSIAGVVDEDGTPFLNQSKYKITDD